MILRNLNVLQSYCNKFSRLLYYVKYLLTRNTFTFLFLMMFSITANHQNFRGTYHRMNNNIPSQNKTKHPLHNNGSNNNNNNNHNNNNNNTSHSPSSRPNTVKRKKHCTMQRGTGDCVR